MFPFPWNQCSLYPLQLLCSSKLATAHLHGIINNRKLNVAWCHLMCLMSCSKLVCFYSVHLEKFRNRYSKEATKVNGGLNVEERSYPNKTFHHASNGASIFYRIYQKLKKSFKRKHTTSTPGYWYCWLPPVQFWSFSVCLFVHL